MTAGPAGPQGPGGPTDPTMPVHPGAGPAYAPPGDPHAGHAAPPGYPPPGYPPPGYGYEQGPGGRDRGAEAAAFARRHLRTPETKEFFKTSEFAVWAFTLILLFVAAATSDAFDGGRLWLYTAIVSSAYILSRGIAKAGTHRGRPEDH